MYLYSHEIAIAVNAFDWYIVLSMAFATCTSRGAAMMLPTNQAGGQGWLHGWVLAQGRYFWRETMGCIIYRHTMTHRFTLSISKLFASTWSGHMANHDCQFDASGISVVIQRGVPLATPTALTMNTPGRVAAAGHVAAFSWPSISGAWDHQLLWEYTLDIIRSNIFKQQRLLSNKFMIKPAKIGSIQPD